MRSNSVQRRSLCRSPVAIAFGRALLMLVFGLIGAGTFGAHAAPGGAANEVPHAHPAIGLTQAVEGRAGDATAVNAHRGVDADLRTGSPAARLGPPVQRYLPTIEMLVAPASGVPASRPRR